MTFRNYFPDLEDNGIFQRNNLRNLEFVNAVHSSRHCLSGVCMGGVSDSSMTWLINYKGSRTCYCAGES